MENKLLILGTGVCCEFWSSFPRKQITLSAVAAGFLAGIALVWLGKGLLGSFFVTIGVTVGVMSALAFIATKKLLRQLLKQPCQITFWQMIRTAASDDVRYGYSLPEHTVVLVCRLGAAKNGSS